MTKWGYVDGNNRLLGLSDGNKSGNSGWEEIGTALTVEDNLFDEKGAALYKIVSGQTQERTEEERRQDWPVDPEPVPTDRERIEVLEDRAETNEANLYYVAMMADIDLPE